MDQAQSEKDHTTPTAVDTDADMVAPEIETDSLGDAHTMLKESAPVDPVKTHTKALEAAMKLDLRKMHALVGQQVDMKHRTFSTLFLYGIRSVKGCSLPVDLLHNQCSPLLYSNFFSSFVSCSGRRSLSETGGSGINQGQFSAKERCYH